MHHIFFFSSRRRHTIYWRDWSSDVCSSDLAFEEAQLVLNEEGVAALAHVGRVVARRRHVEELVQVTLALELVARVEEVVTAQAEVRPRVECVDRADEVEARGAVRLEEEVRGAAWDGGAVAEGVARD